MGLARAIFQAHVDGLLPDSIPTTLQWALTSGVYELLPTTLASGDNTITFPANTTLCALVPPVTNSQALKAKGSAGDTGWTLSATQPTVLTRTAGTVIINAGGTVNGVLLIFLG